MMPSPALSNEDLGHQLTESFACLQAATCQWLVLLAEFDRRQDWAEWGIRSCAHWLNWKCGIDLGAAREKVRVAKALSELPKISHTFEQGRLSYSKVRAMTRVATSDNESELLNIALHGTAAQVEKLVRKYRQVRMADELAERQHEGRFLSYRHDEDGSLVLTVRLPAEDGAILIKALEAALEEVPVSKEDVSAETRVDPYTEEGLDRASERRADALTIVAESFLSNGAASLSGDDRYQVMVHIEADGIPMQAFGGELPAQSQAVMQLLAAQHKANLQIDHRTCVTQWDGSQLDYDLAIEGLLNRDRKDDAFAPL
jgi:hypothetical protein